MSLFTRARRHVDMNRVKELREEKIKEEKIADIQKKQENILAELKKIEIQESLRYSNWRRDLDESMTTAGMGMVNYGPAGDLDIVDNTTALNGLDGQNYSVSGGTVTLTDDGDNDIANGTHTAFRQAWYTVDASKSSHLKVTISKGGGTSSWSDRGESWNDNVYLVVSDYDNFFAPTYYTDNLSSGTNVVKLPGNYKRTLIQVQQFAKLASDGSPGTTGALRITNVSLQRRTPLNVFVPLDDPEANTFIRGGLGGSEERRQRLKEQLEAGNELMIRMGLEPSKTSPGDIALDTIPYEPPSPGPGGYKPPGSYDPNKFYDLKTDPSQLPSPNLPSTGPGRSSAPNKDTLVAAEYPRQDPLDKLLKDIDDADKKLRKQGPGTRPGKGRGMGDTWEGPGKIV